MKKKVLGLLALPLLLSGCSSISKKVEYEDIEAMINKNESFIFYVGTDSCSGCAYFLKQLKVAKKQYKFESTIYYVDGLKIPYSKLYGEVKDEFNKALPQRFYDNSIYDSEGFYTPSIFRYYQGVLVYSHIESPELEKIPYLFDMKNIDIGYFENVSLLSSFNNYTVYIRKTLPELNSGEETTFYVMQESLTDEQTEYLLDLTESTALKDIIKIEYTNNQISKVS